MNNVLNMQVIEQLTVATQTQVTTIELFCGQINSAFQSHLKSFDGMILYQRRDDSFLAQIQKLDHAIDPAQLIAGLSAVQGNQHHIADSNVYLPLQTDHILCLIIKDTEEQQAIHWSIIQHILSCELQRITSQGIVQQYSQMQDTLHTLADKIGIDSGDQNLLDNLHSIFAHLQDQILTQQLLSDLATFSNSNQDENVLLDIGAEALIFILNVDHVSIMLSDEDGQYANLVTNMPKRETTIQRLPIIGEIWSKLAQGEHVVIHNIKNLSGRGTSSSKQSLEAMNISSTVLIPFINMSGELLGSVGLDMFEGKISLTDEQLQTAKMIVVQILTQLQNIRLIKNSQRFANQMQQIAKYSETVQSRLDLEEILRTTLHFAKSILDVDFINVVLYEERLQKLIIKGYHLNDKDALLPLNNPTMPLENTVIGKVWQTREAIYVGNFQSGKYTHPIAQNIQSMYATPLITRGIIRGVVEIGKSESDGIRSIDRSVLAQLANQLSVALENISTYSQSQRLAQNKVLANEIALHLQQQMDMDSLLNTTVNELGKALGAKRARIRLGIQQVTADS